VLQRSNAATLLKWVGSKRQLLPRLRPFYAPAFNRYIEPFFGSGAVFFDLQESGRLVGHEAILMDSNPDLIGCYTQVRDDCDAVVRELDMLAAGYARDGRAHYYDVRDHRFNPMRDANRLADGGIAYTPELAAMFIYLNRTGFNGLFRVNRLGSFNVPAGRYDRPRICDEVRVRRAAAALAAPGVSLRLASFAIVGTLASGGDFLYFDPPYAPVTRTANFTSYTSQPFGAEAQRMLQHLVVELAGRGCHVLLSNSTAREITALYTARSVREAGLRTLRVPARRSINRDASRRGPVAEYLVTNVAGAR
jgi:DNA adenine methylase